MSEVQNIDFLKIMKIWLIVIVMAIHLEPSLQDCSGDNCDDNYDCGSTCDTCTSSCDSCASSCTQNCNTCQRNCQRRCRTCDCKSVCGKTCTKEKCTCPNMGSPAPPSSPTPITIPIPQPPVAQPPIYIPGTPGTSNANMSSQSDANTNLNLNLSNTLNNMNIVNTTTNVNSNTVNNIHISTTRDSDCREGGTVSIREKCNETAVSEKIVYIPVPRTVTVPVYVTPPAPVVQGPCQCQTCPCPMPPPPPPPRCCVTVVPCVHRDCNPYRYSCGQHCHHSHQYVPENPCISGCQRHDSWTRHSCSSYGTCEDQQQDCSECGSDFYQSYSKYTQCRGCYSPYN